MLRGEIVGFEKPLLKRDYKVLLKTADRDTRVICNFYPPDKFDAVFTTNHGSQLVASIGENRIPLAKVVKPWCCTLSAKHGRIPA